MLGALLHTSISTKMVLLNFEIYNEYGDKRYSKLVINETTTFSDAMQKLKIMTEKYRIQSTDKTSVNWSDKIEEKDNNKTFFLYAIENGYDESEITNEDQISVPSDSENDNLDASVSLFLTFDYYPNLGFRWKHTWSG